MGELDQLAVIVEHPLGRLDLGVQAGDPDGLDGDIGRKGQGRGVGLPARGLGHGAGLCGPSAPDPEEVWIVADKPTQAEDVEGPAGEAAEAEGLAVEELALNPGVQSDLGLQQGLSGLRLGGVPVQGRTGLGEVGRPLQGEADHLIQPGRAKGCPPVPGAGASLLDDPRRRALAGHGVADRSRGPGRGDEGFCRGGAASEEQQARGQYEGSRAEGLQVTPVGHRPSSRHGRTGRRP